MSIDLDSKHSDCSLSAFAVYSSLCYSVDCVAALSVLLSAVKMAPKAARKSHLLSIICALNIPFDLCDTNPDECVKKAGINSGHVLQG